VKRTVVDVPFPGSTPTRKIGLDIRRLFSDVKIKVNGDQVAADIKLEVRADINEYGVLRDIAKPRSWSILNHQLSVCIQREVERTIRKSQQELRADIFNLGEQLRIQDNRNWSRLAPRWDEIYPDIKFNVEVRSILRHRGTTIIPPGVG
jgi:spore germination protein KC